MLRENQIDHLGSVKTSPVGVAAVTALTPAVWGTTYIVATELLPEGRPMLAAVLRALPVGLAFVFWTRRLPQGAWWWRAAVLGLLNIGAFFALLFVAAFRLPGGVAATAGAIQPLVAAGIAAVVLGEAFTRRTAVAGAAGIAGVAMLVLGPDAALDPVGVVAAVAGTISMGTGVVLTKHWGRPVDLITFTGWQLTAGGAVLVPVVLAVEGLPDELTGPNLAGFTWLAVVGTGAAYANWFRGIQRLPVAAVSFLGLLSPLVATLVGWVALDQTLASVQLFGATLVVSAVLIPHLRLRQRLTVVPAPLIPLRCKALSNEIHGRRPAGQRPGPISQAQNSRERMADLLHPEPASQAIRAAHSTRLEIGRPRSYQDLSSR